MGRHQPLLPGGLQKPLDQPHLQGDREQKQEATILQAKEQRLQKQTNIFQTKEQDKTPEQLNEVEIGSLPEKEFVVVIVKMIQDLGKRMEVQTNSLETRMEKMQEMFNKDPEEIKKSQSIMNNSVTDIKNTLEGPRVE